MCFINTHIFISTSLSNVICLFSNLMLWNPLALVGHVTHTHTIYNFWNFVHSFKISHIFHSLRKRLEIGDTSVQFSSSVMSNSLRPHALQHARPPCPSPTPGVHPNWWLASNHLILCHLLLLMSSIFPSIRVFSNESALHIRWPKNWSFNFGPSNEYSGLISSRMDWLDLIAVQGTLKSLLQHHSSKASIYNDYVGINKNAIQTG